MRFFVQWIASERQDASVIPTAFWYFSLSGGVVLLAYALWRRDPIFIMGQATGLAIYCRNLYFVAGPPRSPTGSVRLNVRCRNGSIENVKVCSQSLDGAQCLMRSGRWIAEFGLVIGRSFWAAKRCPLFTVLRTERPYV